MINAWENEKNKVLLKKGMKKRKRRKYGRSMKEKMNEWMTSKRG